jgi:hypothetical protein
MNSLDNQLRKALRREEPPADFLERVMARIQTAPARKPAWSEALRNYFRPPAWRWAAAAGLCLSIGFALVVGVAAYQHRQRTLRTLREGEAARAQVMLALHIASSKLNVVLREVQRADDPQRVRRAPKSEKRMEHL